MPGFAEIDGAYAPVWTPQSLNAREDTNAPADRPDAPVTHRRGIFLEKLEISGLADLGIGRKKSAKALGRKSSRRIATIQQSRLEYLKRSRIGKNEGK